MFLFMRAPAFFRYSIAKKIHLIVTHLRGSHLETIISAVSLLCGCVGGVILSCVRLRGQESLGATLRKVLRTGGGGEER